MGALMPLNVPALVAAKHNDERTLLAIVDRKSKEERKAQPLVCSTLKKYYQS